MRHCAFNRFRSFLAVLLIAAALCGGAACSSSEPRDDRATSASTGTTTTTPPQTKATGSATSVRATRSAALLQQADIPERGTPEFRGVFVTSAFNMDWPSKSGLHWRAQRDEIDAIVNRVVAMKCNVIILQVRAFGDRIRRKSGHAEPEPWAAALRPDRKDPHGKPNPQENKYDPLAEWLHAAHAKGIELHVWINPFRADSLFVVQRGVGNKPLHLPVQASADGFYLTVSPRSLKAQNYLIKEIEQLLDYKFNANDLMPRADAGMTWPGHEGALASVDMMSWTMLLQASGDEGGPDGVLIDHNLPEEPLPPTTLPASGPATRHTALPGGFRLGVPMGLPNTNLSSLTAGTMAMLLTASTFEQSKRDRITWLVKQQSPVPGDAQTSLSAFMARVWSTCSNGKVKFGYNPLVGGTPREKIWLQDGHFDYIVPGLMEMRMQPGAGPGSDEAVFDDTLQEWVDANTYAGNDRKPYIVAGLHSNRVQSPVQGEDEVWQASEILKQVERTRKATNPATEVKGQAFYSWSGLRPPLHGGPADSIGDQLVGQNKPYERRALLPPARTGAAFTNGPTVNFDPGTKKGDWSLQDEKDVRFWAVWQKDANGWGEVTIYPKEKKSIDPNEAGNAVKIAVMAVDGLNRENPIVSDP